MSGAISRRDAAILVAVAAIGAVALLPSLGALRAARTRHAAVIALAAAPSPRPRPLQPSGIAFAGDARAADAALVAAVRDVALREGVLLEQTARLPAPAPGLVARRLIVSGSAGGVPRLVEALESRNPVIRMPRYRLGVTTSGRSLRLEADAVMAFLAP